MKEFFDNLIKQPYGIPLIVAVCVILLFLLSVFLYKIFFKRFYDIVLSFLAIVVLSPFLLFLTVLGAMKMGGNPFFTQKRPGKNEKIFRLYKFRTMNNRKDEEGKLLPDSERLTKYGKFLRAVSLDELPELFNILLGHMSIIGPRPLLVQYLPLYNDEQRKRHKVRPGLSGLAQVSGRNAISWEQKFEKDIEYINHITLFADLKIFFKTIGKVFKRQGISQEGNATMEFFTGSKETNILILSAGRRVELVKAFSAARAKLNIRGKVVAADVSDTAPALYFADSFEIVPRVTDGSYVDALVEVCQKHSISLIVPTIDTELPILSENRERIESVSRIMLSSPECIGVCRDKHKTAEYLSENGFLTPKTLSAEEVQTAEDFPLFIKPLDGSSSINAFTVNNKEELRFFYNYIKNPIVQKKVSGQEYTIDMLCDFDGNLVTIVPRKRLAVRSGEILKGQVEKNQSIIAEMKKLAQVLKPVGHITVQGFLSDEQFVFIEINPRFGGGAPMSIRAGADSCQNLYRLLNGEKLKYNEDYRDNIIFSRFDDCIEVPDDKSGNI